MTFQKFNLDQKILEAISYMNFDTPTPIQEKVIPMILDNRDMIACAQTGTGKTAAFLLPILHKLINKTDRTIDTLILVPTRELAIQIEQQIQGFSFFINTGSVAIYGGGDGSDWALQSEALRKGFDIVVATPGKLLSYLKIGQVNFSNLKHLVLDEADRMLDMGFIADIRAIISYLPAKRQTLMFSATMEQSIRELALDILNDPRQINISLSKPAEGVIQKNCFVLESNKIKVIVQLLEQRPTYDSILIFTSVKIKVNQIVKVLATAGFSVSGISSNLEQDQREEVLRLFAARQVRVLVATDVVSRGIDIKDINMVINYDVPHDADDYIHRVGRTARVNSIGEAITLTTPIDLLRLKRIEKHISYKIPTLIIEGLTSEPPIHKTAKAARTNRTRPDTKNRRKRGNDKRV